MRTVLCFLLLASPAWAAPVLMAEFGNTQTSPPQSGPIATSVDFHFRVNPGGGQWNEPITPSQVGQVISAPTSYVNTVRPYLFTSYIGSHIGHNGTGFDATLDNWLTWPDGSQGLSFNSFVPDLRDYRLTGITRTIDEVILRPVPGNTSKWHDGGSQTIRFYGLEILPLPGDFNSDGFVDGADYARWRNVVAEFGLLPNTTHGFATPADYDLWRANYGRTAFNGGLSSAAIPEPAAMFSFVLGWAVLHILMPFVGYRANGFNDEIYNPVNVIQIEGRAVE